METVETALHSLKNQLQGHEWFANRVERCPVTHNALIAYVHTMNSDVLRTVPDTVDGWNVKINFLSTLCEDPGKYVTVITRPVTSLPLYTPSSVEDESDAMSVQELQSELFALRRECGGKNMSHIFYEIHDGDDAVTDFSSEFPEVRSKMQDLYDQYGFDLLFEELESENA